MSTLNLPIIPAPEPEPEKEKELPVIKEIKEEGLQQQDMFVSPPEPPHLEIKETPAEPPKKPKRKMSEKQLQNLANMRQKRIDKAAARKKEKADKIPAQATPVPRKKMDTIHEAPPPPKMPQTKDGFYDFVNYMEKYKSLKKTWREREAEKAKARAPPPAPQPAPKPAPKPVAKKVDISKAGPNHRQVLAKKKIPTVLSTGNKSSIYDSYF
jgi:hypothetical protein